MKRFAIAVIFVFSAAISSAAAQPMGFFHQEDFAGEHPRPRVKLIAATSASCAIQVRWNAATPTWLELAYIGGVRCDSTTVEAMEAAYGIVKEALVKESFPQRPAPTPVYECSAMVSWDESQPRSPTLSFAGGGCDASNSAALNAAMRSVQCVLSLEIQACIP